MSKMSPAQYVFFKFGGVRATARALGLDPSGVCRWTKLRSVGGRGGDVPNSAQKKILILAKAASLDITPEDLIFGRIMKKEK